MGLVHRSVGNPGNARASPDTAAEMMRHAYRPQSNPSALRLAAGEAGYECGAKQVF
jgi:hypothetical protein